MIYDMIFITIGVICIAIAFYELFHIFKDLFIHGNHLTQPHVLKHIAISVVASGVLIIAFVQVPYQDSLLHQRYLKTGKCEQYMNILPSKMNRCSICIDMHETKHSKDEEDTDYEFDCPCIEKN